MLFRFSCICYLVEIQCMSVAQNELFNEDLLDAIVVQVRLINIICLFYNLMFLYFSSERYFTVQVNTPNNNIVAQDTYSCFIQHYVYEENILQYNLT